MTVAAIIVAAGKGVRAGGSVPKQFASLCGKPMVLHSVAALSLHPAIADIVVVIGEGQEDQAREKLGHSVNYVRLVSGGTERRDSVRAGLEALAEQGIDRRHGQKRAGGVVDQHAGHALLRRMGQDVMLVPGDPMLEKITHPADFATAEARHAASLISRSAMGFDVHRLEAEQELWLGGVLIPHDKGLSGHSDADVALHAITDALLGTIGAGDIGMHFPPSDPKWRGAASAQFLGHAAGLVREQGGIIDFIDLTLICEAPKIGPHREAIRARVAAILRLDPGAVSVKATTTERLGFAGRGEGIAAQAIATVRLAGGAMG